MKIVVLDGYVLNPGDLSWDWLQALGEVKIYPRTPADQVLSRIEGAQIVITNKVPITREIMDACPQMGCIVILATGYNIVDIDAAREKGIYVCNAPAYSTEAVAQFTIALLLEACHHIGEHAHLVQEGAWTASQDFSFWRHPLMELQGKTLGIVGFGSIGRATARIALALGMHVLYTGRRPVESPYPDCRQVPLDTLYAQSDVISLHCPQTAETTGMIDAAALAKMKNGAILLNTARGGLLDAHAVADALRTGKLAYACMDVLAQEPPPADNPLLSAPRCFITPHIAWATLDARRRLMAITEENVRGYLSGRPVHVVNGL